MTITPIWKEMEEATGTVTEWSKIIKILRERLIHWSNSDMIETKELEKFLTSEANKAEMGEMPEIVLCRDCKHWECIDNSDLENYPRNIKPPDGWVDGFCSKLKNGLYVQAYGGNHIETIETDANFWCAYGEEK
jgi:hypothetical protein